jgi:hypothetical protein
VLEEEQEPSAFVLSAIAYFGGVFGVPPPFAGVVIEYL